MPENLENFANPEQTRHAFLHRLGLGIATTIVAPPSLSPDVNAAPQSQNIDHLPSTMQGLQQLDGKQRTLLAVATVSGADAVAYYANQDGVLALQQNMDIYPTLKTTFPQNMNYNNQTHDTDDHVRESSEYHLAVRGQNGALQGIIVLHAPTGEFSRLQSDTQATDPKNMNEPASVRRAKITMAEHILERQKTALLPEWQQLIIKRQPHNQLQEKRDFFKTLREDFIDILGKNTMQADHVQGVADLMMVAVDKVINTPEKTIIDATHKAMLEDITVLHDVGKLQTSVPFLTKRWRPEQTEEGQHLNHYFMWQNHNHPLFTYLALSAYPHDALTTAAHHHGILRYSDKELQMGMGKDYEEFRILKDNMPYDKLSELSKFMRVCDVAESISGSRANKPLAYAIQQMAERAGYDAQSASFRPVHHDCNSIDADSLCMMIDNGFFHAYGQMREQQLDGWKDPNGAKKYDEKSVDAISKDVLEAYHWQERKAGVEARLRAGVAEDTFISQSQAQPLPNRVPPR